MCNTSFQGPLCLQCKPFADDGKMYISKGQNGDCGECPPPWKTYALGAAMLFATCSYQMWFIWNTSKTNREFYDELIEGRRKVNSGPYIRLLTTYNQIITIVGSFNIDFLNFVGVAAETVGNPVSRVLFSVECGLLMFGVAPDSLLKVRILIVVASPWVKWSFLAFFLCCLWKFQMNHHRWEQLGLIALVLILSEQPGIIQEATAYVNCRALDPDVEVEYVRKMNLIQCGTTGYNTFLWTVIIPNIILWGAVIPAAIFLVLRKKKDVLDTKGMRITLGAMYNEYKPEAYYWGVAIMLFKVVLLIMNNLFNDQIRIKAMILLAFFYTYKKVFNKKKPYYFRGLLVSESLALYAYMLTVWFTLLFKESQAEGLVWLKYVSLAVILISNAIAILFIVWKIYQVTREILSETIILQISKLKASKLLSEKDIQNLARKLQNKLREHSVKETDVDKELVEHIRKATMHNFKKPQKSEDANSNENSHHDDNVPLEDQQQSSNTHSIKASSN